MIIVIERLIKPNSELADSVSTWPVLRFWLRTILSYCLHIPMTSFWWPDSYAFMNKHSPSGPTGKSSRLVISFGGSSIYFTVSIPLLRDRIINSFDGFRSVVRPKADFKGNFCRVAGCCCDVDGLSLTIYFLIGGLASCFDLSACDTGFAGCMVGTCSCSIGLVWSVCCII